MVLKEEKVFVTSGKSRGDPCSFRHESYERAKPTPRAAASTINLEEVEVVVDSGASMHMASKKDLNEADRIGDREDIEKSNDGRDSQRRQRYTSVHWTYS